MDEEGWEEVNSEEEKRERERGVGKGQSGSGWVVVTCEANWGSFLVQTFTLLPFVVWLLAVRRAHPDCCPAVDQSLQL